MSDASFEVTQTKDGVQIAIMRLNRGEESGPLGNEHAESTQVLVVIRGEVDAQVGDSRFHLRAGESALVPKGVAHRFVGASLERAVTVNVYSPPAYDARDDA